MSAAENSAVQLARPHPRQAVLVEPGRLELRDFDPIRPGPGELLIEVRCALTCGTDLKVFRRGYHARMIVPPALFGHELAGTVVEAGEGVSDFSPGVKTTFDLQDSPSEWWSRRPESRMALIEVSAMRVAELIGLRQLRLC